MAATTVTPESNPVKEALRQFKIATCTPLMSTGIDAPNEVLPMIYGIATLLQMGFRKEVDGEAVLESANPELIASAFDGIAHLAAMALFQANQE